MLEPGTGKAIELLKGQILRIEQVEGGQCADFNCFNLHDYKEFMHCGRTRTVHGFHPTTGTFMWSAPPRERAMLYILEDTVGRNDVLFPALQRLCLRGRLRLCRAHQLPRHPGRGAARIRPDAG